MNGSVLGKGRREDCTPQASRRGALGIIMKSREKHGLCAQGAQGSTTCLGVKAEIPVPGLTLTGHLLGNTVLKGILPHPEMGASLREWTNDFRLG